MLGVFNVYTSIFSFLYRRKRLLGCGYVGWTVDMLALSAPTVVEMGDVAGVGDRRRNLVVKKCWIWKVKLTSSCCRCSNCWRYESWWCCSGEERRWICQLVLPHPIWHWIYFHPLLHCSFLKSPKITNFLLIANDYLSINFEVKWGKKIQHLLVIFNSVE